MGPLDAVLELAVAWEAGYTFYLSLEFPYPYLELLRNLTDIISAIPQGQGCEFEFNRGHFKVMLVQISEPSIPLGGHSCGVPIYG